MDFVDPRERHDGLVVRRTRELVGPDRFAELSSTQAASVGWVVLSFVFDDADRVLLVDQPWADGWLAPGGSPEPGESLSDAVVREVREETGVEATPVRPRGLEELAFVHERTGESAGFTVVCFEATPDTTEIGDGLGLDDEEILDAAWFEDLPEDVCNRELTEAVYRRCLGGRPLD